MYTTSTLIGKGLEGRFIDAEEVIGLTDEGNYKKVNWSGGEGLLLFCEKTKDSLLNTRRQKRIS